jgi:hypothetical protein
MYNSDLPSRAELPSTRQLIRSTFIAIATAAALLVTVVLPAEYAVDPTGIGRLLGLTKMGEIKQQLAAEADADAALSTAAAEPITIPSTDEPPTLPVASGTPSAVAEAPDQPVWRDEVTLSLAPDEAAEVKLIMKKGETASYEWRVDQGHVNSDLHGDAKGDLFTSYRKGRTEAADAGEVTAAFDGSHGWYWRNRSDVTVTLTLRTNGAYSEVKRVL